MSKSSQIRKKGGADFSHHGVRGMSRTARRIKKKKQGKGKRIKENGGVVSMGKRVGIMLIVSREPCENNSRKDKDSRLNFGAGEGYAVNAGVTELLGA